jgi:hypothetical protein
MERPTSYRISTITCNGDVGCPVALKAFFKHIDISNADGWIFVELGLGEFRGLDPNVKRRNNPDRKNFVNQVTVIRDLGGNYKPNIKLFKNGNVHMTGIRSLPDGERVVSMVADEVRRIAALQGPAEAVVGDEAAGDEAAAEVADPKIVGNIDDIKAGNFHCRMINSDFTAPFRIRRKDLHNMLIAPPYNNISSFQPGTYPGVKIHYFWNPAAPAGPAAHGRCECMQHGAENMCIGKGAGKGIGDCKKVTVAVFESGKVLVSGATNIDQVNAAYKFICDVIMMHVDRLQKIVHVLPVRA